MKHNTPEISAANFLSLKLGLMLGLGLLCSAAFGCTAQGAGTDMEDDGDWPNGEQVAVTTQALSCQGASCDGLNPQQTSCVQDQENTGVGAGVFDNSGRQIGAVSLFRSRACQTVWAASAFYTSGGPRNFRICSVRRRAAENDPSCYDYVSSYGNVAPMKYANQGKVVFGRITIDSNGSKAVTPDYTVP